MSPIELIYKTMFNHFVKMKGYNRYTYISASLGTCIFNVFFLLNVYVIINITLNNSISLPFKGKVIGLFITAISMLVNHYLLFKVFEFSKIGDGTGHLFKMDKKTYSLGWIIFTVNILLAFSITMIWSVFFK